MIKIIECPRDAMQGWPTFIPTETKIKYLNALLRVGFDTLDFGSFVSARAIPQMQDTEEVLENLDCNSSHTKLLAIVANLRGAKKAANFKQITYMGFPLSLSETFQLRNTNKSSAEAFTELAGIQDICVKSGKGLVVYLSMGFGNPYQDPWSAEQVVALVQKMLPLQIKEISLADTVGLATPEIIHHLFSYLVPAFPAISFGAHFHSRPGNWLPKIQTAYEAGCQRFDGALKGYGGCPMAKDELIGNIATENLIAYFENIGLNLKLNKLALSEALQQVSAVFSS